MLVSVQPVYCKLCRDENYLLCRISALPRCCPFRTLNIPEQPATNNQQSNEAVMQLTELFAIHSDIDPAFLCQRILKI